MKTRNFKITRKVTMLLSAILLSEQLASTGAVLYAHAEEVTPVEYTIEHSVTSSWDGGCTAEIILTNQAEMDTENWSVTFCTKDEITNLWGGRITECEELLVSDASVEAVEAVEETEERYGEAEEETESEEITADEAETEETTVEVAEAEEAVEETVETETTAEDAETEETVEDEAEAEETAEDVAETEEATEEALEEAAEMLTNEELEEILEEELLEEELDVEAEEEAEEETEEENNLYFRYTVEALDYNAVIPAGGSVTIGYNANGDEHDIWDEQATIVLQEIEEVEEESNPVGGTYEGDGYTVEVVVPAYWDGAYNLQLRITNTSEETLHNWAFVMETNDSISGMYNAVELSNNDGVRLIKNVGYNQDIPAGGTVELGYSANYDENFDVPSDFALSQIEKQVTTAECEVSLFVTEEWEDGGLAEIILTNISEQPIEDWMLEFDSELDIVNIWDGVIVSRDEEHYYIRNAEYAQNIAAGESWTVGVLFSGTVADIRNVEVRQILAKDPSESEGRYDNLTDGVIDLGDIEYLRSMGELELSYHDDNRLSFILGDFYKRPLNSKEDVANLLNNSSSLWGNGFVASADNISHQTSGVGDDLTNYYSYAPTVNGVPVFGSQINVMVDAKGTLCALFNSYESNIYSVNSTPSITAAQAEQIAMDAVMEREDVKNFIDRSYDAIIELYGEGIIEKEELTDEFKKSVSVKSSMYIHCFNYEEEPKLIYEIEVCNSLMLDDGEDVISINFDDSYYIRANENAGYIQRVLSNKHSNSLTATDASNQTRTIEVTQNGTNYELYDQTRNIQTFKVTRQRSFLWFYDYFRPGALVTFGINDTVEPEAVSVHANMAKVYDYYKNVLHRDSYNDKGATIVVSYGYPADINSYWVGGDEYIYFTKDGGLSRTVDIAGHEFTHAVVDYTVILRGNNNMFVKSMEYYGETGALEEAYADIMGLFIEGKSDDGKWMMGEDSDQIIRDLQNPDPKYYQASHYSEMHDSTWSIYEAGDAGGVHIYSSIYSHAVYHMVTAKENAGISDEKWAKVFYESLYNLKVNATFLDARHSVVAVAKKNGFTGEQIQAIKEAFDNAGIVETDTLRIILTWGDTPSDLDSHLVGPALVPTGSRFHCYYGNKDIGSIENNTWVADLDYDDTTAKGPEVITLREYLPGTYYYYVYNFSNHGILNSTDLANSNATVRIYRGGDSNPSNTYTVVPNKAGAYWNVFKITIDDHKNIGISSINTYTTYEAYQ